MSEPRSLFNEFGDRWASEAHRLNDSEHEQARRRLWADMEAYEKSGGKITKIESGISALHNGEPKNPHNIPDPDGARKRAHENSMDTVRAKKAKKGRARMTLNHTAIMKSIQDLTGLGMKTNMINIIRETGQVERSIQERLNVLIIRGFVSEKNGRQYDLTAQGMAYINSERA